MIQAKCGVVVVVVVASMRDPSIAQATAISPTHIWVTHNTNNINTSASPKPYPNSA